MTGLEVEDLRFRRARGGGLHLWLACGKGVVGSLWRFVWGILKKRTAFQLCFSTASVVALLC